MNPTTMKIIVRIQTILNRKTRDHGCSINYASQFKSKSDHIRELTSINNTILLPSADQFDSVDSLPDDVFVIGALSDENSIAFIGDVESDLDGWLI